MRIFVFCSLLSIAPAFSQIQASVDHPDQAYKPGEPVCLQVKLEAPGQKLKSGSMAFYLPDGNHSIGGVINYQQTGEREIKICQVISKSTMGGLYTLNSITLTGMDDNGRDYRSNELKGRVTITVANDIKELPGIESIQVLPRR